MKTLQPCITLIHLPSLDKKNNLIECNKYYIYLKCRKCLICVSGLKYGVRCCQPSLSTSPGPSSSLLVWLVEESKACSTDAERQIPDKNISNEIKFYLSCAPNTTCVDLTVKFLLTRPLTNNAVQDKKKTIC